MNKDCKMWTVSFCKYDSSNRIIVGTRDEHKLSPALHVDRLFINSQDFEMIASFSVSKQDDNSGTIAFSGSIWPGILRQ